jgi:hypothetical protein
MRSFFSMFISIYVKISAPDLSVLLSFRAPMTPVAKEEPGFAVVSPIGRSSVEMIQQAPRLQTLNGKTIAVVGVSFCCAEYIYRMVPF